VPTDPLDHPSLRPRGHPLTIALYVSSHGFGHAVRCAALCGALLAECPEVRIVVLTGAPAAIFPPGVEVERGVIDAGVVQPNSLEIDARATLERYAALVADEPPRIEAEAARLREIGAHVVVADVPAAAFEIAARAGIPGLALGNFSWDWIYEPFVEQHPEHAPLVAHLRGQYARASRLLRLPFHGGLTAFPVVEDVPLIARASQADRRETRRALGLPPETPLVLFSFGGHASAQPDPERLARMNRYAFVATGAARTTGGLSAGPLSGSLSNDDAPADRLGPNLYVVPPMADRYIDLLAACDAAVVKPGYGIVADLIANRVPALYVSRDGYREEPVLVRALEEEARAIAVDREALGALDLGPALDRLLAMDRPWSDRPLDGAAVVARRILEIAG
jgi:UDP:flavonoid glycosyltransferase YjiC (YdhE family)